ncbi:MAG TPA: D-alanyl-D-alanine carboxypeptidase family protein [Xanthobacteraceae bacterium]|nr:D-alanyl-D-alanine carboxypeptidase family protein [Xanthobacteraceae bacterium]
MCAGSVVLALAVAGVGVAEAKSKRKSAPVRPNVARAVDSGPWKRGYADIVIDAKTGRVLHEENADALRHPASVTKIMTLYLLFEQLESRRLKLDSELPVSAYAARQQPTKLGVKPGSSVSVEDAIKALVTRSANDVSVVIAEAIAGDADTFATMMTRKARALGMSRTVFKNPNGLPDPEQVTTARDLATLGRAIQERFPRYYPYFATRTFYYKGVAIANHNKLLGRVEGLDGIKTGYTAASGFNLVTNVNRDGRHIVAVVLGGTSGGARDARMARLITDELPRAYAGSPTIGPVAEAGEAAEDVSPLRKLANLLPGASAPAAQPQPAAPAPVALIPPVVATPAPVAPAAVAAMPVVKPRAVVASAGMNLLPAAPVTVATSPVPAPAPDRGVAVRAALPPAPGSTDPIVPTAVKTVAVARPVGPVASPSGAPGQLGTLTFSNAGATAQPVKLASAGPVELPRQIAAAAAPAPAGARSGWAIQIGAFGNEAEAQTHIAKARAKAGAALGKADPYTERASKGASEVVRARFAGFTAQASAQQACAALKRSDFACMVVRN